MLSETTPPDQLGSCDKFVMDDLPPVPFWLVRRYYRHVAAARRQFFDILLKSFYLSHEWRQLAFDTKVRYGSKCMCCGATPEDGVVIVTDHIKPLRIYWELRLAPDNVQVLCEPCNLGKGSWYDMDFRPVPDRGVP